MPERFQLKASGGKWIIITRKGASAATDAAWITLGGCPNHLVAMRVYLALKARGGR